MPFINPLSEFHIFNPTIATKVGFFMQKTNNYHLQTCHGRCKIIEEL